MFTKRFLLGAVVASLVIAAMGAGTASASRVSVESGTLVYTAEPGEANDLFIYPAQVPGYTGVYDDGASVTTGSGCNVAPEVFVGIPPFADLYYICSGVTNGIKVDLGDGNDFAGMEVAGGVTVHAGAGNDDVYSIDGDDVLDGGPGDDSLEGGPGKDALTGGDGNDTLDGDYLSYPEESSQVPKDVEDFRGFETADGGADVLDGGAGDDILRGNGGTDRITGGAGMDTVDYAWKKNAVTVTLDGVANDGASGERDAVAADVESVTTGFGNDHVLGNAGDNKIDTGYGDDTVDGGEGVDTIKLGPGGDHASLRDKSVDSIDCGAGTDDVAVDALDTADGCESLARSALKPLALTLKAKLGSGGRVRMAGKLRLPKGVDKRACVGSAVRLVVRGGGRSQSTTAIFGEGCKYSGSVSIGATGPLKAQAQFVGSPTLARLFSRFVSVKR